MSILSARGGVQLCNVYGTTTEPLFVQTDVGYRHWAPKPCTSLIPSRAPVPINFSQIILEPLKLYASLDPAPN